MGDGPKMIFVAVGEHEAAEGLSRPLDKGGIRHLYVGFLRAVLGKGDAAVHHEPAVVMALEVEVHSDLTGAAEG